MSVLWVLASAPSLMAAPAQPQPVNPSQGRLDRPAATVGGEAIEWRELAPRLAEAAGAVVLEEAVLDRLAAAELRKRGISLRPEDVEHESALLTETLTRSAGEASADDRARLIDAVRRSRGLGEARYNAMLTRNATLRRLVQDDVKISEADVAQAYQVRYGAKCRIRLIVVRGQQEAAAARARVVEPDGTAKSAAAFGEVAAEVSIDASRVRGGAVDPLSVADPTYPAGLRQEIGTLEIGQVSQPVGVDGGLAIIRLDEKLPASAVPLADVAEDLRRELRLIRERQLMDKLAARLLAGAVVTIFDPSLEWSWRGRERARPQ